MDARTLRVLEFQGIIDMLVERASSVMGREAASSLLPSADFNAVSEALADTTDGVRMIFSRGSPPPGGLHDIRDALNRLRIGGGLGAGDLLKVAGFLNACRAYRNYAGTDPDSGLANAINCLMTDRELENRIYNAIKSEEEISDNASPELASIRRKIREKHEQVRERLNSTIASQKYRKIIQEPIITMRDGRYVIPVRQENRSEFPGIVHDISASGATLFMEPMAVVEINNDIKQLSIREQHEIERILSELSGLVAARLEDLTENIRLITRIDFIFAKAKLAIDLDCTCPVLDGKRSEMIIKKGRHPFLDRKTVVPIDIALGGAYHTLVITGPNTGGKTVSLKTAGLFSLMTQAGLHIPAADGTKMPVFTNIHADIGDEQSIAQSLSTFSSHMSYITRIMEKAGSGSLVLLDELGAGTDPSEGAALGMAILENLGARGALTIATTHYAELKVYAETTDGVENASCEFDVETLKPTYRLLIGIPGKSNAFAISQRLGLDSKIIDRAREFLTGEEIRFEDMLSSIEKDRKLAEEARIKYESLKLEASGLKKEIEQKKSDMEKQKQTFLREARNEARSILDNARNDALRILAELRNLADVPDRKERNREGQELYQNLKNKLGSIEEELGGFSDKSGILQKSDVQGAILSASELKPGDTVYVMSLDKKGEVAALQGKSGEVLVQVGLLKINCNIGDLRKTSEDRKTTPGPAASISSAAKARTISASLDIRGMTVEEAIPLIDMYIDDAGVAGLHEVSIIHGKGTGALRKGVHEHLKGKKEARSFRLGNIGEGDTGVTVVEL